MLNQARGVKFFAALGLCIAVLFLNLERQSRENLVRRRYFRLSNTERFMSCWFGTILNYLLLKFPLFDRNRDQCKQWILPPKPGHGF